MNKEFKKEISELRLDCYDSSQLCDMLHLIDQLAEKVEEHEKYIEDLEYDVRQIQQNEC